MSGTKEFNASPTISRFIKSRALIKGIIGPFGSGKSVGCVMGLASLAAMQEPSADGVRHSRFAVIRNTYRQLQDTTMNTVFDWFPNGYAGKYRPSEHRYILEYGDIKSELLFRALDRPEDVDNLLSLELTGAWLNEYREIPFDVLVNLLGRVGRYPGDKKARMRTIMMDTNPPPMGSPWYDLFEESLDPAVEAALSRALANSVDGDRPLLELFRQPGGKDENAENLENLPEGYYDTMIALNADKGDDWVNVHVHAQYGPDPSNLPVFPQYRASLHAPDPFVYKLNPGAQVYIGMDFGRTPACVLCQQMPNLRWAVFAEVVTENCTTEEFVPKLDALLHRWGLTKEDVMIFGDPAGGYGTEQDRRTSFDILRQNGYVVHAGAKSPEVRLGAIRGLLSTLIEGVPALVINKAECPTLARGFASEYKYSRNQEGEMKPEPRKNKYSHPHDALQHLLGRFKSGKAHKPQDTILPKNKPWTPYA